MLFIITESHVKRNLSKFGFKSFDVNIVQSLNSSLHAFLEKKVRKAIKKAKGVSRLEAQHVGGRVSMPSEYFGIQSNHYVETLNNNGVDMTVNNMWIRPPMDLMAPTVATSTAATGGAANTPVFSLSLSVFRNACSEAIQKVSRDTSLSLDAQKSLHSDFLRLMTEFMTSVAKKAKDGHLGVRHVQEVLSQKKYALFRKN